MFISKAMAAAGDAATTAATQAAPSMPSAGDALMANLMMVLVLVVLFYLLLIVPQQKRFKKHRAMLGGLRKGDKVLLASGFIGKIEKVTDGEDEVVIDLGDKVKVTAIRSAIQEKMEA